MSRTTRRIAEAWRRRRDDDGFTLVEMLVSLGITSVVMVLVTGAVLLASGTSARVEAAATAQSQVHQAFDRLDKQVRWAAAFSTPATTGTTAWAEWLTTASGTSVCSQLQLDRSRGQLRLRTWTQGTPRTVSTWQVLASGVTATTPFVVPTDSAAYSLARLQITLTSTAGGAKRTDSATSDVTFTALNSTGVAPSPTVCTEGRDFA